MIKKISTEYFVINEETKERISVTVYEKTVEIMPDNNSNNGSFNFIGSDPVRVKRIANLILEAAEIKF